MGAKKEKEIKYGPYIVWANYGTEGWEPTSCKNFEEAVIKREVIMGHGYSEVIITEFIPIKTIDLRQQY